MTPVVGGSAGPVPSTLSRRWLIRGSAGLVGVAALSTTTACTSDPPADTESTQSTQSSTRNSSASGPPATTASASSTSAAGGVFAELDAKIVSSMDRLGVPGVAIGMFHEGREYLKGYGVTSVAAPQPVTEDTLFRIGSTNKSFTGTTVMTLVEAGKLDLDATVRTYLPDFATSDPSVAQTVTLRQLLNHTPGWLGEFDRDFGRGDDALTRYSAAMVDLPILTPPGSTFSYNNAALALAGRVIEVATGLPYQQAVQQLVLDPLQLNHTRFFADEIIGYSIAGSHTAVDGAPVTDPALWFFPRSLAPAGGLVSSVRDQLRYARFHLGQVQAADGSAILSPQSLEAMRSDPGPGGTISVELDGMGVTWQLRPSAEGVRIVQHDGDVSGQHNGFLFIPERDFALTVLTNSDSGSRLLYDFVTDDWALRTCVGLHNVPATPQDRAADELAAYEGTYTREEIGITATGVTDWSDTVSTTSYRLTPDQGRLKYRQLDPSGTPIEPGPGGLDSLVFYRDDYVALTTTDGVQSALRANFVRDGDGAVTWFRTSGRLHRRSP